MGVWCFSNLRTVYLLECSTERGCCSHFAGLPVHFHKKYKQIYAISVADQWQVWGVEDITSEHISCVTHDDKMLLIFKQFFTLLFFFTDDHRLYSTWSFNFVTVSKVTHNNCFAPTCIQHNLHSICASLVCE